MAIGNRTLHRRVIACLAVPLAAAALLLGWLALSAPGDGRAAPPPAAPALEPDVAVISLTQLTFDMVGLDAANVNTGPNTFPVGVRLCNSGDTQATNLTATFRWLASDPTTDPLFGPRDPQSLSIATLDPGDANCEDLYYTVALTRTVDALDALRDYDIQVSGGGISATEFFTSGLLVLDDFTATNAQFVAGTALTGPGTVTAGGVYTYVVTGSSVPEVDDLEHYLVFPPGRFRMTGVQASYENPAGSTWDAAYVSSFDVGNVISGAFTVTYTLQALTNGPAELTHVIYGTAAADGVTYYDTFTPAQQGGPDLQIQKAGPTSVQAGLPTTYTLSVANVGDTAVTGTITVSDTLPSLIESPQIISASGWNPCAVSGSVVTCVFSSTTGLQPNGILNAITVRGTVAATATGTITNTATVTNPNITDSNPANNRAQAATTIGAQIQQPDLRMQKIASSSTILIGQPVTYTLTVNNAGGVALTGTVTISDTLPAVIGSPTVTSFSGWTPCTITNQVLTCTHPNTAGLGANAALPSVMVRGTLSTSASGTINNVASVSAAGFTDPVPANNRAQASFAVNTGTTTPTVTTTPTGTITPNMAVTASVSPAEARVAANLTFTIQVRNNGSANATNVVVTNSFPAQLDVTSATATGVTPSTSGRTVTTSLGTMDPNESATITIVTRVNTTATTQQTLSHAATVTFTYAGTNRSTSSNTVSFRVLPTLPGTGFAPVREPSFAGSDEVVTASTIPGSEERLKPSLHEIDERAGGTAALLAVLTGALLGLLGLGALGLVLWARRARPAWAEGWSAWIGRTGLILLAASAVFLLAGWGLDRVGRSSEPLALAPAETGPITSPTAPTLNQVEPDLVWPTNTPEPEFLPDFPIPSPEVTITPGSPAPDTSAVTRLLIPALGIDNVVKYVPFNGATWMIAGLREEIAWLGETSWPGLGGNTALAAHITLRDGSNGPFRHLEELGTGERVTLHTEQNIYTYQVRDERVVPDTDFSVVAADSGAPGRLTLITCAGWNEEMKMYINRVVITADLVEVEPRAAAAGDRESANLR